MNSCSIVLAEPAALAAVGPVNRRRRRHQLPGWPATGQHRTVHESGYPADRRGRDATDAPAAWHANATGAATARDTRPLPGGVAMGSAASASAACCSGTSRSRRPEPATDDGGKLRVVEVVELGAAAAAGDDARRAGASASGVVTLVTQCSEDRLPQLARTAAGWGGHVVVAVLLQSLPSTARARIRQQLLHCVEEGGHLCVLLCVVQDRRQPRSEALLTPGTLYPINALRNLALAAADTDLIMLVDVDQVPSVGLQAALAARGTVLTEAMLSTRTALVVPAFEAVNGLELFDAQLSISQLADWRRAGSVATFGAKTYPLGHGSTDEAGWLRLASGQDPTPLDPRDWPCCLYLEGYEPYVIISRVGAPPFDERYEGYGRNKIAWCRHLSLLGFTFHACPLGYLLHQPHAPSAAFGEFKARRMDTVLALDAAAAAQLRADPRGAVWKHAPGFASADLRRRGDARSHSLQEAAMWTQLGRWRTIAAAMAAQQLLAQAPGDRLPTTVRLRLEQLFYLQHEYIRDEVLLQPRNIPLHTGEATSLLSERSKEVWVATHATLEYAPQLAALLAAWAGPASIALVAAPSQVRAARCVAENLSKVTTHRLLVMAVVVNWCRGAGSLREGGLMYPSNLARKAAFSAVPSPAWVWQLDADLLPCAAARERLQAQLEQIDTLTVAVTPTLEAFELADFAQAVGEADIAAVREMVRVNKLALFHSQHFSAGHGATDIDRWLRQPDSAPEGGSGPAYEVAYERGFEPFAVIHTDLATACSQQVNGDGTRPPLPLFETTFRHPHKDKCAHYLRLSFCCKQFLVLPDVCLFAPPHTASTLRRAQRAADGDLFAKAAGEARFVSYHEEIARASGIELTSENTSDGSRSLRRADEVMLVQGIVWRGEVNGTDTPADNGSGFRGPIPFWSGWPLSGGVDTLRNVAAVQTNGPDGLRSLRVRFPNGQMGLQTKLLLPTKHCDFEAGLACDVYFPSCFPSSDGRGGKLPGLALVDLGADVLSCCFRWATDGQLCFGVVAAAPAQVRWSRTTEFRGLSATAQIENFDRNTTKMLWHGPIVHDHWTNLRQELVLGGAEGTVEIRAAVNGVVVVDAVVSTMPDHVAEERSIGPRIGDWGWEPNTSSRVPPGDGSSQQTARIVVKLHVFASFPLSLSDLTPDCRSAPQADDSIDTPWLGLRALAVTGASPVRTIVVIGFHHSGTSVLRHIIGSHPQAHEHVPEIIPTPAQLRGLRNQAVAAGRSFLVIKHPVNNLEDLKRAACLQRDENVRFVHIRRNLPDVINSLAKRFRCQGCDLQAEVEAWRAVEHAIDQEELFACSITGASSPVVLHLEELACRPEQVVRELCIKLGLEFDMSMLDRPEDIVVSNQGVQPVTEHDKLRIAQINGPLQPYNWHPWDEESSGVSEEDRCFLRGLTSTT